MNTASSTDNTITNKTYNDLTNITIKQYNIRHKDTASYDTLKQLKGNEIMLLQEPYLVNKRLAYTPLSHKTRLPNTKDDWVSIVLPEAIDGKTQKLGQYCNKNMIFTKTREWLGKLSLILASIYMPKNETSPDIGNDIIDNIRGATKEARKIGAPLIMGADTNAKHKKLWNSRSTCSRGRQLAQLFKELDLIVINNGINTTYQNTMGGSSTIDITITNRKGFEILKNWEVDNETSLSDHKIIKFQVNKTKNKPLIVPDLKNIDWPTFEATCKDSSETKPFKYKKVTDSKKNISTIDSNLKHITDILEHAFDKACPKKKIEMNGKTPSINPKIKNLIKKAKRDRSKVILTNKEDDRETAKNTEKELRKEIKKINRKEFRDRNTNLQNMRKIAALSKTNNNFLNHIDQLKNKKGKLTQTTEETLTTLADELLKTDTIHEPKTPTNNQETKEIINKIINKKQCMKVIKGFQKHKAPGPDKIRNEMIAHAWPSIEGPVIHILKQCLTNGYTAKNWTNGNGVIIAKEGKDDYSNPRAYRIITLTSSLLKMLEKLILLYLEEELKIDTRLTSNQFGFRKRKSTDTANHRLTRKIEGAINNGNFALGIFLDIEGAFDNIKFNRIYQALIDAQIPEIISIWIYNMLINRTVTLELHGTKIVRKIYRGCPQGGILSPLLWNLTLNTLLNKKELDADFLQAFADDLAILIPGFDLNITMRDKATRYLKIIKRWCTQNGLKLSTLKTNLIIFTKQRKKYNFRPIIIDGEIIKKKDQVKYLGVIYDQHLTWFPHIKAKCSAAKKLIHNYSKATGKSWGLEPNKTRWLYLQVVLSTLAYSCFLWAHKLTTKKSIRLLESVQKLASIKITMGFKTTPLCTLNALAGLTPIDIKIKELAIKSVLRLKTNKTWNCPRNDNNSHAYYIDQLIKTSKIFKNGIDDISETEKPTNYKITHSSKQIDQTLNNTTANDILIYTDGSQMPNETGSENTGAGITITQNNILLYEKSVPLGSRCTNNQGEMYAINHAMTWLSNSEITNSNVLLFTDSSVCLAQLDKNTTNSELTLKTNSLINIQKDKNITVHLYKIPAHQGYSGNDRADELAKQGTKSEPIGKPPVKPNRATIDISLYSLHIKEHKQRLLNTKLNDENHSLINLYASHNKLDKLPLHRKSDLRIFTHLISGQNHLAANESKRNSDISPHCQHCTNYKETATHFLGECPAYSNTRYKIFEETSITMTELLKHKPQKIMEFVKKSGRLSNYEITDDSQIADT